MEAAELALHLSQRIDAAFPGHAAGAAVLKATDALAEMVLALPIGPPSEGPWQIDLTGEAHLSGAVLITDPFGRIIGWMTDAAGHTTEQALPDGRSPDQIFANAVAASQTWELLGIAELLHAIAPLLLQLHTAGTTQHAALMALQGRARRVLRLVGILP